MKLRFGSALAGALLTASLLGVPAMTFGGEEIDLSRRDIVAQEGMNRSTEAVVMLGWMQLIVSVVGSALVLASLGMSRRAIAVSMEAMAEQRETTKHQIRAYLGWIKPDEINDREGSVKTGFRYRNFGQTPASNVRVWWRTSQMVGKPTYLPVVKPKAEDFKGGRFLAPGATGSVGQYWEFTDDEREKLASNRMYCGFQMIILYEDIYGITHALSHSAVRFGRDLELSDIDSAFSVDLADYSSIAEVPTSEPQPWWKLLFGGDPKGGVPD